MLDTNARKALKYFIKTRTNQTISTIACNVKLSKDEDKSYDLLEISLKDLLETKCIEKTSYSSNGQIYRLTNFGKMYFKKSFKDIFYRYLYPILTASISLILSLLLK